MTESTYKKIRNPIRNGIIVLSVSIVVVIFASKLLYDRTSDLLTENLRERILTISITAASNIDASDLDALRTENDWQKPEWARVVNKLHRAKYSNKDVVFMYVFRKKVNNENGMEFVADADSINPYATGIDVNRDGIVEPDGPDKLQWPGQDYPEAVDIPEAFEAYNGPTTSRELYTDAYGTVLTGYAPIKDDSGKTVAVLATDIKADDFFTITRQTLLPFVIFILFLTGVITILEIIIITSWRKYAGSLEQLNTQIAIANEKLKELDQLKSEFLSLATHQIRSPLTAIKGYASLLIEGDYGALPPTAKDALQVIYNSTQNLVGIVGDFLDISRIEQGRMVYNKEVFDICELARATATALEPNVSHAGLKMVVNIPEGEHYNVNADKGKITQIISNIIDNAIKYSLKGSIEIKAGESSGRASISVKDTGIGIEKEELSKLFNKFSRTANAHKTNVTGTGLGLYIAKKMAEAHGGDIKVSSGGHGKGSIFTLELPKV